MSLDIKMPRDVRSGEPKVDVTRIDFSVCSPITRPAAIARSQSGIRQVKASKLSLSFPFTRTPNDSAFSQKHLPPFPKFDPRRFYQLLFLSLVFSLTFLLFLSLHFFSAKGINSRFCAFVPSHDSFDAFIDPHTLSLSPFFSL